MRQLTFLEKGKLEWQEASDPKLEGDGQALVRPVALATCDIDAAFVQGRFLGPVPIEALPGLGDQLDRVLEHLLARGVEPQRDVGLGHGSDATPLLLLLGSCQLA